MLFRPNETPFEPKITYKDDHKQKRESVTATVDFALPYPFENLISACGATEDEARENLMNDIEELVTEINDKHKQLIVALLDKRLSNKEEDVYKLNKTALKNINQGEMKDRIRASIFMTPVYYQIRNMTTDYSSIHGASCTTILVLEFSSKETIEITACLGKNQDTIDFGMVLSDDSSRLLSDFYFELKKQIKEAIIMHNKYLGETVPMYLRRVEPVILNTVRSFHLPGCIQVEAL